MRVLLAISVIYHITSAQKVGINVPCNKELDGLLTADPDGDERAFMSCQGVGVGTIGFWERKLCPNNMVFDFINQQCKEQKKKARKQQTLSIAILNNSCANGETCIGGSVCDLDTLRCMCPYGTIPKLDTLSCESSQPPFVSATVDGPSQFFNSLSGANGNRNNQNNQNNHNNNGFVPFGQSPDFQPNNNFKFNNFGNNQNNQNNGNNNDNFNWNPNFNWNANNNMNKQASIVNNGAGTSDFSNPFQPNPNQKFVFNFNKNQGNQMNQNGNNNNNNKNQNIPIVEVKPKVATLAIPGASCKSNEICVGGSICTLPIGICLCPGDLEARDGECVLPASSTISVQKVGIGALCSDLAECDHGSTCVMGRCTCVSPLIQHEGKCVLRQQQKVVGPGELCDNGEICGRGSVCDVMIPVCVCPAHTDLNNGECISVTAPVTQPVIMTPPPTLPPVQVPVQTMTPPTRPPPPPPVQITQPPVQPTVQQLYFQTTPPPLQTYPTTPAPTPFVPKQSYTAPPQLPKSSVKVNQIKLGGSKQAGVGVRCSLNTDCMIGAYCNGNTSPPSCQCLSTHVNIEGRCEKVVYPGQVGCRSDLQCQAASGNAKCIDRICVCPEGQKAVDQTCVSGSSLPNNVCGFSSTNPCSNKSVCYQNRCICPDRHSLNPSSESCEVTSPEHTECSMACFYPRSCINNVCVCPDNVDCVRQAKLRARRQSEICSDNIEICKSRNAVCVGGICQCAFGFHEIQGSCESDNRNSKPVQNVSTCINHKDCPDHYSCESGKCRCETEEYDINGNCLPALFHGAFKNINNQCSVQDRCAGGSKCKDGLCQCVDGAVELTGKCKQFPGGHCSNGEMCSGGSSCYLGKCRCDPSRTLDNQRCVQMTVPIGSTCRRGQQCVNGAACRFGVCMCVSKFIAVLGRCVHGSDAVETSLGQIPNNKIGVDKKPGSSCESEDTCTGGSSCLDGTCLCGAGYILESDKCLFPEIETSTSTTTTVTGSDASDGCSSDEDCSEKKFCSNGNCECLPGLALIDSHCQEKERVAFSSHPSKSTPGSQCSSSSECSFRTKCIEGVCRCKKGETIIDSTCRSAIHHVLPGLACDPANGYDCMGESLCQYGVCKCKRRLVSDGQKCVPLHLALMVVPGKSCAKGEPCGGGSYCAKDGICRCMNDEVADVNKKCVKKSSVVSVFNRIKPIETTKSPMTTTFPTTTTTNDDTYIQRKINELEIMEMEFKKTISPGVSAPAVHRPSTSILAGHHCTQNSECPSFSFCFANACNCMAGFRATSGICEPAIAVGEPCMTSNQCFDDSECVFGICTCTGTNCKDVKMMHPGEDCTAVKVVCSYNSYCSLMSGVCECPSGMATKGKTCENTFESIGKDCVTSRNCQKSSYCDNGYCVCKNGHKISDTMCFNSPPEIKSFGILPFDKNMGENTPLQNNMKNEFAGLQEMSNEGLFHTTTKWPEILSFTMISPAPDTNQPSSMFPQIFSSFPVAYGAKTVAEEENNSTMKYKIAFPGEYCGSGEVCLGNSVCESHFCRCLQDVAAENGLCPAQIDDLRVLGLQPLGKEVTQEFRMSPGKKIELRKMTSLPLENCQNEEKCENNSTCQSILGLGKICQCVENTVFWNGECIVIEDTYDIVAIDGTCNMDSMCLSGSECISEKCTCPERKRLILGICVEVALPETSCESGEVCINGSICGDSNCECTDGTSNENGNCVAMLRNESEEEVTTEEPLEENLDEDESADHNENGVRSLVRRELASIDCANDSECQPNFKCHEYVCVCDDNTENCLASIVDLQVLVPPGSGCDSNRKCGNDSICFKDYCVCSYEDIPEDDHCVARDWHVGLGSQCSNVTRCREGLQCMSGLCMCKFGDVNCNPSEPVTSPPGGSCSNLRECTGGSVCREGWCICPDPSMIVNRGICIQSGPKPTLPPRTTIPQVPLPPQLPIQSVHIPQVTITKAQPFVTEAPPQGKKIVPGGRCGPIDVCVGGSNCIEGFCLCPAGQQPSNNGRCEKFTTTSRQSTPVYTTTQGTTALPPSVFTSAFTIADLLSTRRPPAFIEIPTHEPLTTTQNVQTDDECTAIGLICKGNTVCRNKSCQCPDGYVLHHDGCVSPEEAARRKARGKARHEATTARVYSKPGESCNQGQTCVGGSSCSFRKLCECPQEKSEISNGQCVTPRKIEVVPGASCNANTICTKGSTCDGGLCRCQPGYIAVSGNCVALPMPTTPKMKTIAKPLESCENGETCEGGSSCDMDTGICMCPPGQIVFNVQCMPPPTQPQITTRVTAPTVMTTPRTTFATDCEKDANCGTNKICVSGKCKCRPGFVDNSGTCEPLEDIDVIERPIPVSYAKHKVATLSERMLPREEIELSNIEPVTIATPAMQETQKPKIVGPPIRRPRPKNKNSGRGSGGSGGSGGSRSYKTGGSGNGNCPPGNEATRDDSGKLIMCNGLEPNCPPRSYCYITTGGFATEEYNCCKSW